MPSKVDVLLRKMDEALDRVRKEYEANLRAKELSDDLLFDVHQVVTLVQSALDWTAGDVKKAMGKSNDWKPYFPLVKDPTKFDAELDKQLKGVTTTMPKVAKAIEAHQPYQTDHEVLGHLKKLGNANKHDDFTAQTRDETRQIDVRGPSGSGISFTPYQPGKGGVSFGGQVFINGVEVDNQTLQPIGGGSKPYTETIYVDWRFVEPDVSVLPTLETLADLGHTTVDEVRHAIDLTLSSTSKARS